MTLRYIRRIIWSWQDWRASKKLERAVPGLRERRAKIAAARKQHRQTRPIERAQRDAMSAALAGRS